MFSSFITYLSLHTPLFYLIQPIWRDEGFSYFMAKAGLLNIILNSINDFNPPLYYLLLHVWMGVTGESDVGLRMLSFLFHVLTTYYTFLLARKLFNEKFSYFVTFLTFFNPMLLYYGFEMRMYAAFAFFTVASLYYLVEKRWRAYILFATLGMYTHSFFILIIFSEVVYLFHTKQLTKQILFLVGRPVLLFLPWVPFLLWQFKESKNSWMFPVDLQLVKSSLGNLFIGYEGTPGGLWGRTAILSLLILIAVIGAWSRDRKRGSLFVPLTVAPLLLILSYSILRRPIYVNRYLIFVTIGEIFSIATFLWSIKNKSMQKVCVLFTACLTLYLTFTAVSFHKKTDYRTPIQEIAKIAKSDDVVFAQSPLVYFEAAFYYPKRENVFIYNPQNIAIPKYIGTSVIPASRNAPDFPDAPVRTFLLHENTTYEEIIKMPSQN